MHVLLKCELKKLIKTKAFWWAFLLPLIMAAVGLRNVYIGMVPSNDLIDVVYVQTVILYGGLTFPIAFSAIIALQWRIEYKNRNIINLSILPVSKTRIYVAKIMVTTMLAVIHILICAACMNLFMKCVYTTENIPAFFVTSPVLAMVLMIPFLMVQHFVSMVYKNFLAPLSVGILMTFGGFLVCSTAVGMLFPTTYLFYGLLYNTPRMGDVVNPFVFAVAPVMAALSVWAGIKKFKRLEI